MFEIEHSVSSRAVGDSHSEPVPHDELSQSAAYRARTLRRHSASFAPSHPGLSPSAFSCSAVLCIEPMRTSESGAR